MHLLLSLVVYIECGSVMKKSSRSDSRPSNTPLNRTTVDEQIVLWGNTC